MKGTSVHIKDIMELNSSVIIRFEILLWLSGCENVSGPSRNGPLPWPEFAFLVLTKRKAGSGIEIVWNGGMRSLLWFLRHAQWPAFVYVICSNLDFTAWKIDIDCLRY